MINRYRATIQYTRGTMDSPWCTTTGERYTHAESEEEAREYIQDEAAMQGLEYFKITDIKEMPVIRFRNIELKRRVDGEGNHYGIAVVWDNDQRHFCEVRSGEPEVLVNALRTLAIGIETDIAAGKL